VDRDGLTGVREALGGLLDEARAAAERRDGR
jgi:hypothetical protein